ncbi:urease accessory protein UreD [Cereibacter azotoformans]|uniref:urease accessory protein UreD n=1 Tax=Cereibacter azotoformans TaxID=43057 RepID=UPI001EEB6A1C|nr:urease accessory protein UreD [Cereibacter azotoformans]ULB09235.1 urease accessory protein UreD [Cereibacter azotoformans]
MNALTPPRDCLERSQGHAQVTLARVRGAVRLRDLAQRGSAKAFLPRVDGPVPEIVFLNTSGGLTGGDRLSYRLEVGEGCRAVATTQTAERAYAAGRGVAQVRVAHEVGAGGWLDWLPQETILFEDSALDRRTEIVLGPGAGCLMVESVVLGRAAMGETLSRLAFRDLRQITRGGRPVLVEPLALDDRALAAAAGAAVLGGLRALATLALVGPGAEDALGPARAVLDEPGVEAAASAFDGKLLVRMLALDGWPLRRQVARVLGVLRGRALPRVWQD